MLPSQQRPDYRDESGDLDADEPKEVATHLLVQGVAGQVDLGIHHVEPPLDAVQPRVDSPFQAVDSAFQTGKSRVSPPFQADERVADAVGVARMFGRSGGIGGMGRYVVSGSSRTVRWGDCTWRPASAGP